MWRFAWHGAVGDYKPEEVIVHTTGETPHTAFSWLVGLKEAFSSWDDNTDIAINAHGSSDGQGVHQIVVTTHPMPQEKGPLVKPTNTTEQTFTMSQASPAADPGADTKLANSVDGE